MKRENFQKIVDGKQIDLFELSNKNGMKVFITNYGAKIVSILAADKNGNFDDLVLGFDTIDEYLQKETYFGTVCGRVANRIKDGKFTLEGTDYSFVQNNGTNHLHGGNIGFNQKIWEVKNSSSIELELVYYSPDGEEGYPGNLLTTVTYSLNDDNELKVNYKAASDKTTIV
ncbi:MAG: galactose-1-epimerase, partial [Paludibacteraceae bacterium]|nr:galactose-1-epimerase [Paludibacteraceae bacterium]